MKDAADVELKGQISDGTSSTDKLAIKLDELLKEKGTKLAKGAKTDDVTTYKLDVEAAASKATVCFVLNDANGKKVTDKTYDCTLTPQQADANLEIQVNSKISADDPIVFRIINKDAANEVDISGYTLAIAIDDATKELKIEAQDGNGDVKSAESFSSKLPEGAKITPSAKITLTYPTYKVDTTKLKTASKATITILLKDKDGKEAAKKTINWTSVLIKLKISSAKMQRRGQKALKIRIQNIGKHIINLEGASFKLISVQEAQQKTEVDAKNLAGKALQIVEPKKKKLKKYEELKLEVPVPNNVKTHPVVGKTYKFVVEANLKDATPIMLTAVLKVDPK